MSQKRHRITFPHSDFTELTCDPGAPLGPLIDGRGPIEFGCFSGVCGTCIATVHATDPTQLPPKSEAEAALLAFYGKEAATTRLACLLQVHTDLAITGEDA